MVNPDEAAKVASAMALYGGSFVKALAKALACADYENQEKIKECFSEYWAKYKGFTK